MENKIIDLHTHTTYSDGELNPNELIKLAINNNVGTIAITDHNTTNGLKNLDKNKYRNKIRIINGIELSAEYDFGRMHILGYGIDPFNEELNKKMKLQENYSLNKVLTIIEQIKRDYKIFFEKEDFLDLLTANHSIGRPDIAQLCVKRNYCQTEDEAFIKFLNPVYQKTKSFNQRLSYEECFEIIKHSGGIPSLAHPKSLNLNEKDFLILLKEMISYGLEAIEVYHSYHTPKEMSFYLNAALDNNLLVSGGSDYHGPHKKANIMVGSGINNNLNLQELSLIRALK